MKDCNQLLKQIEITRERMMQLALMRGFQDQDVIVLSHQLDELLNKYEYLKGE